MNLEGQATNNVKLQDRRKHVTEGDVISALDGSR